MMNSDQCRGKARQALAYADASREPGVKLFYEAIADEWQLLAVSARLQDDLQRELSNRMAP